jgi:hypothetical protein
MVPLLCLFSFDTNFDKFPNYKQVGIKTEINEAWSIKGIRLPFLSSDSLPNIYTLSARFLLKSNNVNEVFFFITILYKDYVQEP